MQITFASYNIHKAVGTDGRRDPDRILSVLREIDADVIALQEADRRFGDRASVLPRHAIDEHSPWRAVSLGGRPDSIGWHGNALLVRRGIEVASAAAVPLPAPGIALERPHRTMRTRQTLTVGTDRFRVGPWQGMADVAYLAVGVDPPRPSVQGLRTALDRLAADVRDRLAKRGLDVSSASDDDLRVGMQMQAEMFRDAAPTTAAQAATVILDGVRAERWRILVGDDAVSLDELVRQYPTDAYDDAFLPHLKARGLFSFATG